MSRPPVCPVEEKMQIVLSILAGDVSIAEAARRARVSAQSVANWRHQFLESGRAGLATSTGGRSAREQRLEAELADVIVALSEADVLRRVTGECGGPTGSFEDLEALRLETEMSTVKFCQLIGVPERTWRRHQARVRPDGAAGVHWREFPG